MTKAEADEAMGPTAEEQAVIDAGKVAQAKVDREGFSVFAPLGRPSPFRYTEAFAKAGDVPTAPADHVTGVTDPESVTVDTERDVQQFGSDTVKLKSQTITGSFTMQEAQPEHFQRIFPS